jgi:glycosyltransferase involved in cell wall biosynthesis
MNDVATPLVSVVIPTYNHARYLGRALQSVLDQTYTNWEVIVIDNHSTDNTDEVIASFMDPRVTYLKIHNNGVIAASRNAGIRAAKGKWIAFLDSDDWWANDKLQVCFDCIDEKVDLIYHDLVIIHDQSRPFRQKKVKAWQVKAPVLKDLLLRGNAISNSSVVVRKRLLEKIGGINESVKLIAAEDYNTWLHISKRTNQFLYLPHKLGYYLIHNQGLSKKDMSESYLGAINEFTDVLSSRQQRIVESKAAYMSGRYYYLKNENKVAIIKLLKSLVGGISEVRFKAIFMLMGIVLKESFKKLRCKKRIF